MTTPLPQKIMGWAAVVCVVCGWVIAGAVGRAAGLTLAGTGVMLGIAWAITASITEKLDDLIAVTADRDDAR